MSAIPTHKSAPTLHIESSENSPDEEYREANLATRPVLNISTHNAGLKYAVSTALRPDEKDLFEKLEGERNRVLALPQEQPRETRESQETDELNLIAREQWKELYDLHVHVLENLKHNLKGP